MRGAVVKTCLDSILPDAQSTQAIRIRGEMLSREVRTGLPLNLNTCANSASDARC